MGKKILKIFTFVLITLLISGCIGKKDDVEKINLSIVQEPDTRQNETGLRVAIASVISPKESYVYYEEMIQYISGKLGMPVKIIQKRSYQEVNDLMKNNDIDLAFVCSGAYIDGMSEFGMKLLVAPQVQGKTTYQSYIIVPKDSDYNDLQDLRGKKFAFTDPLSNSGKLYPSYRLALLNETPESFFGIDDKGRTKFFFTYSHDSSVIAVAQGLARGAAVDSFVYEYMNITKPDIISRTRIIEISPPFGIPPVVVSKDVDPFLEQKLKDIFLNMDRDEKGRKILDNIMIDKFVTINDSAYDSIREMRKRVK